MTLSTGQILNNRYRIVKRIAQGGFGAVYRAWDLNLKKACAIKENFETSPHARQQFEREALLLANLHHPSLPKVTDHFIIPDQGQYLVMDFVEGEDLQEMLDRTSAPLPEKQVLDWIEQVCDALVYLHRQNPPIIHRDIKPANIKITPEGKAVLVDFGIAKVYDPHLSTMAGARAVTPGYSPPEQYGHGKTDVRSDIYALGATLYTLLTGQVPPESIDRTIGTPLAPPRQINPNISTNVEIAIINAMQLMPADRLVTASAFRGNLKSPTTFGLTNGERSVRPAATTIINTKHKKNALPIATIAAAFVGLLCLGIFLIAGGGLLSEDEAIPPTVSQRAILTPLPDETKTQHPPDSTVIVFAPPTHTATRNDVVTPPLATPAPLPSKTATPTQESTWRQGKLVFPARQGGRTALYTLNLRVGDDPHLLYAPSSDALILAPAWSPDGSRVAFHQYSGSLQIINAQSGGQPRSLQACSVASWLRDGSQVLCKNVAQSSFDILDAGSGSLIERIAVDSDALLPGWSPTRDEVVYVIANSAGTQIWRLAMNSDLPVLLAGDAFENYAPSWSPDGEWIAYQSTQTSTLSEIWVMDRSGGNRQQITHTPGGSWSRAPSWSPDGMWLAFVSNRGESFGAEYGEIYIVSLQSGKEVQVTNTGGKIYNWRVAWGP